MKLGLVVGKVGVSVAENGNLNRAKIFNFLFIVISRVLTILAVPAHTLFGLVQVRTQYAYVPVFLQ